MSYHWLNRKKYWKMQETNIITNEVKKTTEYYENNIEFLKEDARSKYRNLSEKEKEKNETDITWILI